MAQANVLKALLELGLYTIAAIHHSFRSVASPALKKYVFERAPAVTVWMLRHQFIFPLISVYRLMGGMDLKPDDTIARWGVLLDLVHTWTSAPPTALGNIYLELASAYTASNLPRREHNTKKNCVMALAHFHGSGDTSYRERCRAVFADLAVDRESRILGPSKLLHYFTIRNTHMELLRKGHYARAQAVLLKGASMAAKESSREFFWTFHAALDDLEKKMGPTRLRILGKLIQIMVMLDQSGQVSKVLESLRGVFAAVMATQNLYLTGMHAAACSTAYQQLGRANIARFWARECWLSWQFCCDDQASEGAWLYFPTLVAELAHKKAAGTLTPSRVSALKAKVAKQIADDFAHQRWGNGTIGTCLLARISAELEDKFQDARLALESHIAWIAREKNLPDAYRLRTQVVQLRCAYVLADASTTKTGKRNAVAELKKLVAEAPDVSSKSYAFLNSHVGLVQLAYSNDLADGPGDLRHIHSAALLLRVARLLFDRGGLLVPCLDASIRYSKCLYMIWQASKKAEEAERAFQAIQVAEYWLDRRRRELASMSGMFAIMEQRNLSRDSRIEELWSMRFDMALALQNGLEPWLCVANAKARSVSDSMSLRLDIPERLAWQLEAVSPEAHALLQMHRSIESQVGGETTPEARLLLRAADEGFIVRQLEAQLELDEIHAALTGRGLRETDVWATFKLLEDLQLADDLRMTFVDWFIYKGRVTMCALSGKKPAKFWTLKITEKEVEDWLVRYFSTSEGLAECLDVDPLEPDTPFRDLDALVAPLAEYAYENELLVLFPCRILHGIPLHALNVTPPGSEPVPLIERYRVVYSASFAVFSQCLKASLATLSSNMYGIGYRPVVPYVDSKYAFVGVYEDGPDKNQEEDAVAEHIVTLASAENDPTFLVGEAATARSFAESCAGAKLIHFHGHCELDSNHVLDQALVLHADDASDAPVHSPESAPNKVLEADKALGEMMLALNLNRLKVQGDDDESPAETDVDGAYPACLLYETNNLDNLSLGSIAMTFAASREEANDIQSELEIGANTPSREFPIRRVFDLKLSAPHGALVMLMACQSSVQSVGPGDEPLGLATGFLCAGATSVVGSLWKVRSRYARVFSDAFHKKLRKHREECFIDHVEGIAELSRQDEKVMLALSLVSLADVFREAVCNVKDDDDTRNYRFWAPFTLTGSPLSLWTDTIDQDQRA